MSRRPTSSGPPASINPTDDICPVCKSNRYLNPTLTFLINPECYHTMCTSCVDRLFTSGPAPCPVAGCHKTLRKRGFHKAFFADLTIEREVDVRKRVGAVFNRRQEDFETLRDWNNYLEMVEDLVFNIVEGTSKEKIQAEETLKAYADENRREIEENIRAEKEDVEMIKQTRAAEADAARRRRMMAAKEHEEERLDMERSKRDVLHRLATTDGDAEEITRQGQKVVSSKAEKRRGDAAELGARLDSSLTIRGLKKRVALVAEKPYDAFGGMDLTPSRYLLQKEYGNEWLENAKNDPRHMIGGFSLPEYYARTMFEAFSGLGVFIEDEISSRADPPKDTAGEPVATRNSNDDVF